MLVIDCDLHSKIIFLCSYIYIAIIRKKVAVNITYIVLLLSDCVSSDIPSDLLVTHADAGKLLSTLLKLRQACCHPQVGSSGLRSLQQSPMTMEEILMVFLK